MRLLGKQKYDYVSASFKNVLTICWYFSYIGFSCTMLYCIRVFRVLLKVIYLPRLDFKPVNFLRVCCLLIDASSSWFPWVMQPKSSEATGMRLVTVLYGRPFFPRIFGMFSKIAVFFGSNLFCDSKTSCVYLRSTGFSLLYANFDNLLENHCGQS